MAKWLSVRLQTVRVQLQSLKLQISRVLRSRSSLSFRQLCGFTLKRVPDLTRTYTVKEFLLSHFFSSAYVFTECYTQLFCNNSFDVKTIKLKRLHNRKTFLFHVSFKLVWLKREMKIFLLINYSWKKNIL